MNSVVASQPNWETDLAPRILLGLWHPKFIPAAKQHLPYCRRAMITVSTALARKYFWDHVDAFSVAFGALATADGAKFRAECKAAGKQLMVWTVNEPEQMMEAVRWGVDAILTDVTKTWLDLRASLACKSSVSHAADFNVNLLPQLITTAPCVVTAACSSGLQFSSTHLSGSLAPTRSRFIWR